jgi:hypothetical protein
VYLVVRGIDLPTVGRELRQVSLPLVGVYLLTLAVTHLFRVSRWAHLLAPIGVSAEVQGPVRDLVGGLPGDPGPAVRLGRVHPPLLRRAQRPVAHERSGWARWLWNASSTAC